MDDLPRLTTQTVIGISVAISGNVLISFALNLQKLAHKRLDSLKNDDSNKNGPMRPLISTGRHLSSRPSLNEQDEDSDTIAEHPNSLSQNSSTPESEPLLYAVDRPRNYIPLQREGGDTEDEFQNPGFFRRIFLSKRLMHKKQPVTILPVHIISEDEALCGTDTRSHKSGEDDDGQHNETDYLKSKLWWTGFILMNIGELGNFISYAFAPASVVAPLGTFALIANCAFAPLMLGEHFRKRDFLGVCAAIVGAVTVVLSSNASDARLDPQQLVEAITQTPFLVYAGCYIGGAIILAGLSQGKLGRTYVFIDVGLCALFGGFTVLSTKAISTLITLKWYGIFAEWITYPLIITLLGTGIGQIRYLNRALMRFDAKAVIPSQFVFFTLSAIVGSAILYGDFRKAGFHEVLTFLYGCAAIFAGVHILARDANEHGESTFHTTEPGENVEDNNRDGTIGRRRAALVLPGVESSRETSSVRKKNSIAAVVGLSPAQLLLVHTPTRESPSLPRDWDVGYEDGDRDAVGTPSSYGRNRTLNGFGNDGTWSGPGSPQSRTRTANLATDRLRTPRNHGSPTTGNVGGS